jgi:alkanesulfonate monooxygenase SsuD/methylene tetrahydromethanopterin reductase-like flavin-dependent oxidoreductase (luciferase family)
MPPFRIGITLPPVFPVQMQLGMIMALEWMGYDSVWLPDHLVFPDHLLAPDPWSIMAAASSVTRRIVFGTAVTDCHRTHPAVMAHRLATLDRLSRGRIILGLGAGETMNLDPFGIDWNRPFSRLKEYMTVLRHLLDSREPLTFRGEFYQLENVRLSVRPYKNRKIPIYLAALGPKMQELAGQVADGWVPTTLPISHYASTFAPIAEAARAAGRDPDSLDRCANYIVGTGRNPDKIYEVLQDHALDIVWPPILKKMGLDYPIAPELAEVTYANVNPYDEPQRRRFLEHQRQVPREILKQFMTVGSLEQIRQGARDLKAAGASHLQIVNASLDPTAYLTLATALAPLRGRAAFLPLRVASSAARTLRALRLIPDANPEKGLAWLNSLS